MCFHVFHCLGKKVQGKKERVCNDRRNHGAGDDCARRHRRGLADAAAQACIRGFRVLHRPPAQTRSVGPGIVEAFYAGLATVNLNEYDFLCKLVIWNVAPDYFGNILRLSSLLLDPSSRNG